MNNLATKNEAALDFQRPVEPSITSIIAQAVQSGRSADELQKLLDFARELDKDKARKEFAEAMAEFKRTCPKIVRRTENSQFKVMRNGVSRNRTYASLADIEEAIGPTLATVGLTCSFTDAEVVGNELKVGCIVQHRGGHVADPRYVSFPLESQAGASAQQKRASVIEYCRRYALKNALGLTDCDDDDRDGNEEGAAGPTITEAQANSLNDALLEVHADMAAFKRVFGVAKLADLPAKDLDRAHAMIASKKRSAKA